MKKLWISIGMVLGLFAAPAIAKAQETLPVIQDVTVSVTGDKVTVNFKPADGLSTMVVKSDKLTAPTVSGKLEKGSTLGTDGSDGTVMDILDATTETCDLAIAAGEGFFLHFYGIQDAGTDNATYSTAVSATAYRPFETLPLTWSFNENQAVSYPTELPLLPPGWQHDAGSTIEGAKYFSVGNSYFDAVGYGLKATLSEAGEVSVITPSFVSNTPTIEVVFTTYFSYYTPVEGDWIRIECRKDGGEWQDVNTFTHNDLVAINDLTTLSVVLKDTKDKVVEIRYTLNITTAWTSHYIKSVDVKQGTSCFPPKNIVQNPDSTTDTQLLLSWQDPDNETASYVVYYTAYAFDGNHPYAIGSEQTSIKLTGLNPNTFYGIEIQAVCSAGDTSAHNTGFFYALSHAGLPYKESLADEQLDLNDPSLLYKPVNRNIKTYTGHIGGELTEDDSYGTWKTIYSLSGRTSSTGRAIGTYEEAKAAVFVSPYIYTEEPTVMNFTLNSFSLTKDEEFNFELKEKGVAPTEDSCRLYVAVSNEGEFTMEDVVLTLKGAELKLIDSTFELNVDKTGAVQIAFFFENPVEHWDDAFYLEAYDLSLTSVPQEYTLSLTATPAEGGTVTGAGRHKEGATVTVTATANEGYDFVAWMNGSAELAKTASYTFTMPAGDVSYTAVFRSNTPVVEPEEYELTLTASPANAGRVSGDGPYLAGEDVTISAEANQGYKFVAWVNGTDTLSKEATYTFQMPAKDTAFTARFVPEAANEEALRAGFSLGAKNGHLYIRNINGLTVKSVEVYSLTGHRINRFATESREDLILPVDAERALLFVRLDTEKGAAVYKVYLH